MTGRREQGGMDGLEVPDQSAGDRNPRRICDDLLPTASFEGEDLKFVLVPIDEPAEKEAACWTGNENIAVQRAGIILGP